jgi:hypothetical protein
MVLVQKEIRCPPWGRILVALGPGLGPGLRREDEGMVESMTYNYWINHN